MRPYTEVGGTSRRRGGYQPPAGRPPQISTAPCRGGLNIRPWQWQFLRCLPGRIYNAPLHRDRWCTAPYHKKAPQVDQTCGVFYKREGGNEKENCFLQVYLSKELLKNLEVNYEIFFKRLTAPPQWSSSPRRSGGRGHLHWPRWSASSTGGTWCLWLPPRPR